MSPWDTIYACSASVVASAFCPRSRRIDEWTAPELALLCGKLRDGSFVMVEQCWQCWDQVIARLLQKNNCRKSTRWGNELTLRSMSPTGRSFAELFYLHEDLLLAMTEQVVSTLLLGRLGLCGASKKGPVAWQSFSFRKDTNQRYGIWGFRISLWFLSQFVCQCHSKAVNGSRSKVVWSIQNV